MIVFIGCVVSVLEVIGFLWLTVLIVAVRASATRLVVVVDFVACFVVVAVIVIVVIVGVVVEAFVVMVVIFARVVYFD